jgi:hypothetical protein
MSTPTDTATRGEVPADSTSPPHPVNVTFGTYRYATGGEFGRAMYERLKTETGGAREHYWQRRADLPHVHARVVRRDGSRRRTGTEYLLSVAPDGHRVIVSDVDLADGSWAVKLGMNLSGDRNIITAAGTAVRQIAHRFAPEQEATARPDVHTASGHLDLPVAECLPDGYLTMSPLTEPEAARETWREVVGILARNPKMALTVGASAGAPYVGPLRRQSHWWDLYGDPRKGKSTTQAAAAAVWGDPRIGTGIVLGWNASSIGSGRHLSQLGILPPYFDERGLAPFGREQWGELVFSTCQGASRLTAERLGSGNRRSSPWFGVLFSTGNARLTDGITAGRFAGIPARVIELATPFTQDAAEAKRLTDALLPRCYGWLGEAILRAYPVPEVRELLEWAADAVGTPDGGVPGTLAEHLHLAVAGAAMIDATVGAGSALADAAVLAAREHLEMHGHEPEHDADRMLDALAESLASNRPAWPTAAEYAELGCSRPGAGGFGGDQARTELAQHGYDGESSGVRSDDGAWLYVFPKTWHRIAAELGADESVACAELYRRKVLHVPPSLRQKGKWQALPRVNGKATKVYQVALAAVERDDQDDDQDVTAAAPETPSAGVRDHQDVTAAVPAAPEVLTLPTGPCQTCAAPGMWCGGPVSGETAEPCVLCSAPTAIRSACGAPRHARQCPGTAELELVTEQRQKQPGKARIGRPAAPGRTDRKRNVTTVAALDLSPVEAARELPEDEARTAVQKAAIPAAMALLEATREHGRYDLVCFPPLPEPLVKPSPSKPDQVWEARPKWTRSGLPDGLAVDILDVNAAYLSALRTHVPIGALRHIAGGELPAKHAGIHLIDPPKWTEEDMPNPLGNRDELGPVWITTSTLRLLSQLASDKGGNRIAPVTTHESWVSGSTENLFEGMRQVLRDARSTAVAENEWLIEEYIKSVYSKFVSTLGDSKKNFAITRPDVMHITRAQAYANLWRRADKARAGGLTVVRVGGTDELHVAGDWRSIWKEGRALTEMKCKGSYIIGGGR